ncbi:hypothetical protein Rsub_04560 [Raphidocelis subcapitata]|uniref:Uncharacterized protein n=1 Tax=Raphidocelis subcapitata TaxID=307507 RepID=A0A2V0NXV9_9CHLO|nr:hypothetical protein Rsub_04560 [Raphidocelis subcapitata]|eukprot:GBF92456.1 hypothetical protein Rsub_04560 [Raphidocelis subcapitata]
MAHSHGLSDGKGLRKERPRGAHRRAAGLPLRRLHPRAGHEPGAWGGGAGTGHALDDRARRGHLPSSDRICGGRVRKLPRRRRRVPAAGGRLPRAVAAAVQQPHLQPLPDRLGPKPAVPPAGRGGRGGRWQPLFGLVAGGARARTDRHAAHPLAGVCAAAPHHNGHARGAAAGGGAAETARPPHPGRVHHAGNSGGRAVALGVWRPRGRPPRRRRHAGAGHAARQRRAGLARGLPPGQLGCLGHAALVLSADFHEPRAAGQRSHPGLHSLGLLRPIHPPPAVAGAVWGAAPAVLGPSLPVCIKDGPRGRAVRRLLITHARRRRAPKARRSVAGLQRLHQRRDDSVRERAGRRLLRQRLLKAQRGLLRRRGLRRRVPRGLGRRRHGVVEASRLVVGGGFWAGGRPPKAHARAAAAGAAETLPGAPDSPRPRVVPRAPDPAAASFLRCISRPRRPRNLRQ